MTFFGMYGSKYIGGNPYMLSGGMYGSSGIYGACGASGIYGSNLGNSSVGGINYFAQAPKKGKKAAAPENNNQVQPQGAQQEASSMLSQFSVDNFIAQTGNSRIQGLQTTLNNAINEQGFIGKAIDKLKGSTGLGLSSQKCQSYIEAAKTGQMSLDEAATKIYSFSSKQKTAVNILTLGLSALLAGISIRKGAKFNSNTLLAAAGIGAGVNAGVKTVDRATNKIENDEFNFGQILKDGLSGALAGGIGGYLKLARPSMGNTPTNNKTPKPSGSKKQPKNSKPTKPQGTNPTTKPQGVDPIAKPTAPKPQAPANSKPQSADPVFGPKNFDNNTKIEGAPKGVADNSAATKKPSGTKTQTGAPTQTPTGASTQTPTGASAQTPTGASTQTPTQPSAGVNPPPQPTAGSSNTSNGQPVPSKDPSTSSKAKKTFAENLKDNLKGLFVKTDNGSANNSSSVENLKNNLARTIISAKEANANKLNSFFGGAN